LNIPWAAFVPAADLPSIEVTAGNPCIDGLCQKAVAVHVIGTAAHEDKARRTARWHQARPEEIERLGEDDPVVRRAEHFPPCFSGEAPALHQLAEAMPEIGNALAIQRRIGDEAYSGIVEFGPQRALSAVDRHLVAEVRQCLRQLHYRGLNPPVGNGYGDFDKGNFHGNGDYGFGFEPSFSLRIYAQGVSRPGRHPGMAGRRLCYS
jgi:hypothetical protein